MNEEKKSRGWAISLGMYPGFLIGMRTYRADDIISHVIYVPFFDIAIQLEN